MIVEFISIAAILVGGSTIAYLSGLRGWGVPALGFVMGIAAGSVLGHVQVFFGIATSSTVTLSLIVLLPITVYFLPVHRKVPVAPLGFRSMCVAFLAIIIAALLFSHAKLLNTTPDSYEYGMIGALYDGGRLALAAPGLLLKRMFTVALLHAPANIQNELFHRSITPVFSLVTVLGLVWFCCKGINGVEKKYGYLHALPWVSGLLLATNPFFVYNAFYVNGHVNYAALLLFVCGSCWLIAEDADVPKTTLYTIVYCCTPALIFVRQESGLHAVLALLPVFSSTKFPYAHKKNLLMVLSVSILGLYGFLSIRFMRSSTVVPFSVVGMLMMGTLLLAGIPVFRSNRWNQFSAHVLPLAEAAMWLLLLMASVFDPTTFFVSCHAAIHNLILGKGMWGYSLVVLGILFLIVRMVAYRSDLAILRFPVSVFIPFGLLLAFVRGAPYRVSPIDSFNRMFLHVVPLAILFISSAFVTIHANSRPKGQPPQ